MSKNKKELFCGASTAIITPFLNGNVDYEAFGNIVDFQTNCGIEAIVVAGTTGEASVLSYDELEKLFEFACGRAEGKTKIIAGCGSNNTLRSVEVALIAERCGCDGVLAVTPYYNRPTSCGLVEHYAKIADAVNVPIIVYNVPSRTGINVEIEVYKELAKISNIVGVKEASGNIAIVEDILSAVGDDLDVYAGNDDITVPVMALGGKGCISVISNLLPQKVVELCKMCADGNIAEAGKLQIELVPVIRAAFSETNPIPIKYVMYRYGFCTLEYRLPMCPPSKETQKNIDAVFMNYI